MGVSCAHQIASCRVLSRWWRGAAVSSWSGEADPPCPVTPSWMNLREGGDRSSYVAERSGGRDTVMCCEPGEKQACMHSPDVDGEHREASPLGRDGWSSCAPKLPVSLRATSCRPSSKCTGVSGSWLVGGMVVIHTQNQPA